MYVSDRRLNVMVDRLSSFRDGDVKHCDSVGEAALIFSGLQTYANRSWPMTCNILHGSVSGNFRWTNRLEMTWCHRRPS